MNIDCSDPITYNFLNAKNITELSQLYFLPYVVFNYSVIN